MKNLFTIDLENTTDAELQDFRKRDAVRAVVFDAEDKVAIINVKRDGYYKILGGGIDEDEKPLQALARECIEEAGVKIKNIQELGTTLEYRKCWNQAQECLCYLAYVDGGKENPEYTEYEKEQNFEILWLDINKALQLMENNLAPEEFGLRYMAQRDYLLLRYVKENILNN